MTPTPTPLPTRVRRRPPKLPLCYPHSKPVTQEKNKLYYGDNYEVLQRYPTQKPEALLERIIKASSNEGDLVLDPFCGCGTTIQVAQRLNRSWIGIDITHLAIGLIKKRLDDGFPDHHPPIRQTYEVIGEPTDYAGAAALAAEDKYQFQWWALGQVGARPAEQRKGADRGIDGRLYFHDDESGKSKQIIFSVPQLPPLTS